MDVQKSARTRCLADNEFDFLFAPKQNGENFLRKM